MRINKLLFLAVAIIMIFLAYICFRLNVRHLDVAYSNKVLRNTWNGYKEYFIADDGRVKRPKENDAVSEGQAYAMLRAVYMNDKEIFDRCYRWTESNLSRAKGKGDNLLAWHWKDGSVIDWNAASDADLDYALSLFFADMRWKNEAPKDMEDYGKKAHKIMEDILKFETYSTPSGRLYLSPWTMNNIKNLVSFPVDPSYYSPAHFRIFYEYTKDIRWQKLVDTTYYLLDALSKNFNGVSGVGLIPDWCSVDAADKFYPLKGRSGNFGWEAVRVPFRISLDYFWFKSKEAKQFFDSGFPKFIEREWLKNRAVYSKYNYKGTLNNKYENAIFYSAYYFSLTVSKLPNASEMLKKARGYIVKDKDKWFYDSTQAYYVNSLAWLSEALNSGELNNFAKEIKGHNK